VFSAQYLLLLYTLRLYEQLHALLLQNQAGSEAQLGVQLLEVQTLLQSREVALAEAQQRVIAANETVDLVQALLNAEQTSRSTDAAAAEAAYTELTAAADKLRQQLAAARSEVDALHSTAAADSEQWQSAAAAAQCAADKRFTAEAALTADARERLAAANESFALLQSMLVAEQTAHANDCAAWEEKYDAAQDAAAAAATAAASAAADAAAALTAEQQRCEALERTVAALEAAAVVAAAALADAHERLAAESERCDTLQQLLQSLREEYAASTAAAAQRQAELEAANADLQERLAAAQQMCDALQAALVQAAADHEAAATAAATAHEAATAAAAASAAAALAEAVELAAADKATAVAVLTGHKTAIVTALLNRIAATADSALTKKCFAALKQWAVASKATRRKATAVKNARLVLDTCASIQRLFQKCSMLDILHSAS
jgi:trimeric autotransporter adhesin